MKTKIDYKRRDELVIGAALEPDSYDVFRFDGLMAHHLTKLIEEGFADPNDQQNEAPKIYEFAKLMRKWPMWRAHGYMVTPLRDDCRISLEGIRYKGKIPAEMRDDFVAYFGHADDFDNEKDYLYAWFD